MNDNRLILILQIFTIILVFKGISATYFATKYAMEGHLDLISEYASLLRIIPIFFLISLIFISIPYFFKINNKNRVLLDKIAISIVVVGLLSLIFLF